MIKSYRSHSGGMAERLKAPVLKTGLVKANVGSNPSPSAFYKAVEERKKPTKNVLNEDPGEVPEWLNGIAC
jgi:hypothetical protein